jgi:hypothetical protein
LGGFKDVRLFPGGADEWGWRKTGTRHDPGFGRSIWRTCSERTKPDVQILSRGVDLVLQVPQSTIDFAQSHAATVLVLESEQADNPRVGAERFRRRRLRSDPREFASAVTWRRRIDGVQRWQDTQKTPTANLVVTFGDRTDPRSIASAACPAASTVYPATVYVDCRRRIRPKERGAPLRSAPRLV